jgi:hypothetical protein
LKQPFWDVTTVGSRLWLLDQGGATLTAMNPDTGDLGSSVGLAGQPTSAISSRRVIWAAASLPSFIRSS